MAKLLSTFVSIILFTSFVFAQDNPKVVELKDRANDLINSNRYEEALLMVKDALKLAPKDAELLFKQGKCLVGLGNFKGAVGPLKQATNIKKDYLEAYEMLGNVFYQLRNVRGAVMAYDKCFRLENDVANKLRYKLEILDILYTLNKYGMAKSHLYDAKTLPDGLGESFDVQFMEAVYLNLSGRYEDALKILDIIIDEEVQVVEGNEKYFFEKGYSYHMLNQYDKSKVEFDKANNGEYKIKIRRYQPGTYYQIATTYYSLLDYETCQKYLDKVYGMKADFPDQNELKLKLAAIKANNSATIKALEDKTKKVTDSRELSKIYEDLSIFYFKAGDYTSSEMYCDKVLEIREFDMKTYFLKAMCEYKLNAPASATELLIRASKNPKLSKEGKAKLNFVLGLLYKSGEQNKKAYKSFRGALYGQYKNAAIWEMEELNRIIQGLGEDPEETEGEESAE